MSERKEWTVDHVLGPQTGSFVGYATDPKVRENAASGGATGAILRYLLREGIVDGVVASRLDVDNGELKPVPSIARDPEELEKCRNSIYLDFNVGAGGIYRTLLNELAEDPGKRFAVVGLFCHLSNLKTSMERRGIARDRVIMIGLFCSHAPEPILMKEVLLRQGARLEDAAEYHTKTGEGLRDGRIYGRSRLDYKDGTSLDFPFIEFTTFKNAWFYTPKKCLVCPDQFSEVADISCGDAWYADIRKHRFKQTTVITRNPEARALILDMVRQGDLELRTVDPASVINSQKRVAGVEKAAMPARVKVARWFGIKMPDGPGRIRLRDLAHSLMMISAVRASTNDRLMRFILKLPTPVVLSFTLVIKLLEQSLIPDFKNTKGVGSVITGHEDGSPSQGGAVNLIDRRPERAEQVTAQ